MLHRSLQWYCGSASGSGFSLWCRSVSSSTTINLKTLPGAFVSIHGFKVRLHGSLWSLAQLLNFNYNSDPASQTDADQCGAQSASMGYSSGSFQQELRLKWTPYPTQGTTKRCAPDNIYYNCEKPKRRVQSISGNMRNTGKIAKYDR
jgi:hypothetical protein